MPISQSPDVNPYLNQSTTRESPAFAATVVTPSDTLDLPVYAKALRVYNTSASPAALRVTPSNQASDAIGSAIDITFPPGLTIEPLSVRRVWATGSAASLTVVAYIG